MNAAYSSFPLMSHMSELFPLCRSITGRGIRLTLDYFEQFHPEYVRFKYPTGTKVFDWEIPNEWNIEDCFVSCRLWRVFC